MHLPEEQIKKAILHPEEEVRLTAVDYFADTYSQDPSLMPLVIEAVEKYGRPDAFSILRRADGLAQTPASIEWLMGQLRRDYDVAKIDQDNYRFAVAILLYEADPELLAPRHREIIALPAFPQPLQGPLNERLKMSFQDWPTLWETFEAFGRKLMDAEKITIADSRRASRICEALARHRSEGSQIVLSLLRPSYKGHDKVLMQWLEPSIVEVAGRMRLTEAIPIILDLDEENDDTVSDEVTFALCRIGGDALVDAIVQRWPSADNECRFTLAETLQHVHTDAALRHLVRFLSKQGDPDLELFVAQSALGHLSPDAIEPVRQVLLEYDEDGMDGELWDLRYHMVAASTLMGTTFQEYEAWHQEAVATKYGETKLRPFEPHRLADAFAEEKPLQDEGVAQ